MTKVTNEALDKTIEIDRIMGEYRGAEDGPTAVFIGGTHGNETSSIFALHRIFKAMNRLQPDFCGEMVAAFAGNIKALEQGVRWIDKDMNRIWITDRLQELGFIDEQNQPVGNEKEQQEELLERLEEVFERARGPVFVFDLHTTSSVSPPFLGISDTVRNRQLALKYPLPTVVGFDEEMRGTLMNYVNERGYSGVALEAGEHYSLQAIENNESFIWYTLQAIGCMTREEIPRYHVHKDNLSIKGLSEKRLFDLKYTYKIDEDEQFQMRPGYATFDPIEKGEELADNEEGAIKAPMGGRIFMPLYQQQGEDGFFIVQEISEFKLDLTRYLREQNMGEYLDLLPGIEEHPDDPNTILVSPKLNQRWFHEFLHAFGYRRKMLKDGRLVVTRREYDTRMPEDLEIVAED